MLNCAAFHSSQTFFSVELFHLIWEGFALLLICPRSASRVTCLAFSECHLVVLMHKRNGLMALHITNYLLHNASSYAP